MDEALTSMAAGLNGKDKKHCCNGCWVVGRGERWSHLDMVRQLRLVKIEFLKWLNETTKQALKSAPLWIIFW